MVWLSSPYFLHLHDLFGIIVIHCFFSAKTRGKSRHNKIQSFSRIVVNTNLPQLFVVPYCESILSRAYTHKSLFTLSMWALHFLLGYCISTYTIHICFFGIFSTTSNAISKYDLILIVQGKIDKKKKWKGMNYDGVQQIIAFYIRIVCCCWFDRYNAWAVVENYSFHKI